MAADKKAGIYHDRGTSCMDHLLEKQIIEELYTAKGSPYLHSARWRTAYMGLLLGFVLYLFRVNISLVLPSMVKFTSPNFTSSLNDSLSSFSNLRDQTSAPYNVENATSLQSTEKVETDNCVEVSRSNTDLNRDGEFSWDRKTQSLILSSYYYGLLAAQVPFGWVTGRIGGKHVTTAAMLVSAVVTLLLPTLARTSVYAVLVVRIVLGVCAGASVPSWYTLLARWALPNERSRFTGIFWLGQYLGTILGFFTSGFLCAHGFDNGWGSVFYIHGTLGVLFVVLWAHVIKEHPRDHPTIHEAELRLLTSRLAVAGQTETNKTLRVPWIKMLTHVPVLVVTATQALDCFVHYLILICLPLYMKGVLKFDIQNNGVFSALPFACSAAGLFLSGLLADLILSRKYLSATVTRKLFQVTAFAGIAAGICLPGFLTCSQQGLVIACLCFCMFSQAVGYSSGYLASPVDIAPRFASLINAIANSFGTISGILAPFAVAELTVHDTAEEWRMVFFIATGCAVIGAVVFGLFSSSELAPWASDSRMYMEITVGDCKGDSSITEPLKVSVVRSVDGQPVTTSET